MAKTILILLLLELVALILKLKIKSGLNYIFSKFWAEKLYPRVSKYGKLDSDNDFAWKCHPDFQGQVKIRVEIYFLKFWAEKF